MKTIKSKIKLPKNQSNSQTLSPDLRQEVTEGLLCAHSRINTNTRKTLEAASFLYALIELMRRPHHHRGTGRV